MSAALAGLLLATGTAGASVPSTYKGTIEGSFKTTDTAVDTGLVYNGLDTIKVFGLKLKRVRVNRRVDRVAANYRVTAGNVTWTSSMTGACTFNYTESFPITSVIPSRRQSVQFDRSTGRWRMFAELNTSKTATVTRNCIGTDGLSSEQEHVIDLPRLLFTGGGSVIQKPAKRIRRVFRQKISDPYSNYDGSWTLSLRR